MIRFQEKGLYLALLSVSLILFVFALGPGLFGSGSSSSLHWEYDVFRMLCHQDPARSYSLDGVTMAVCSRCIGIYGAFALGVLLMPLSARFFSVRNSITKKILLSILLLNFADVLINAIGIWTNTLHSRLLLGILLGYSAALLLTSGFFKKQDEEISYG